MLFVGTHERQLDDKGRLALPAAFRAHLGEHCYLVIGADQCISVIRSDEFETMAEEVIQQVRRGEVSRQLQRAMSASATLVTVDKQGRINVDEKLRSYAGLRTEERVIVTGNFNHIEIWAPDRYEHINAVGTSELAGAAGALGAGAADFAGGAS